MSPIDTSLVIGFLVLMFLAGIYFSRWIKEADDFYVVSRFDTVVQANLTVVAIIDMPIFVIAIVYGLLWRRTNWQGAVGGYVVGALAGALCYRYFNSGPDLGGYRIVQNIFGQSPDWTLWAKSIAAIASTAAALIATPLVTLCFPRPAQTPDMERIYRAFAASEDENAEGGGFGLTPKSARGKLGLLLLAVGFLVFLFGVLSASVGFSAASSTAVAGMLVFFTGGLIRVYSD